VKAANAFVCLLVTILALLAAACAEPQRPSLEVSPDARTLVTGERVKLTVTRRFPGGPVEDVTDSVHYDSSERSVAHVGDDGELVAGRETGSVLLRVYDPSSDATAAAAFTVVAARIEQIEVSPSPAIVMGVGTTRQFEAFARFSDGTTADVTRDVLWSTTNVAAATVGNTSEDKGVVRAVSAGDANILATHIQTGVQGRSIVFVTGASAQLVAILVTPNPATVALGETQAFSALGVLSDGSTHDVSGQVTWSSSRTDIATIDGDGVATGVAEGDTTITATGGEAASTILGSAAARVVP
jgi:hypothetical protein